MSKLYAGIGCRRGCPAEEILALLERALGERTASEVAALATGEAKRGERGIAEAASRLAKPLHYLSQAEMAAVEEGVETRSRPAERALGVAAVAEAAALAAAGPQARLRVPRIQSARATCALAESSS